jgi:hypothetical protein
MATAETTAAMLCLHFDDIDHLTSSSKYRSGIARRGGGVVEERNIRGRRFDQNRRREIAHSRRAGLCIGTACK